MNVKSDTLLLNDGKNRVRSGDKTTVDLRILNKDYRF